MPEYDVLSIGNAIVDIIAQCDEAFLADNGIIKGAMNLIDAERAELLYRRMGPAVEASGGSAGNTAAGIASFGGRSAYFGKVSQDHLGEIFTHDIHAQGVAFDTRPLQGTPPTARSMIFVTPDGERSMNTYLGACVELGPEDVEADKARGAAVTYFEGYLWDPPRQRGDPADGAACPRRRPQGVDVAVGQFLRRPLPWRIPRPDAFAHGRHRFRQQP